MDLPQNKKVKLLKIDILNWPSHVFGFHDKCDRIFKIKLLGSYNARCNTAVSTYNYGQNYDNFIRSQPILAWECIQKSLLPKKTKGDILKKQIVKLILDQKKKSGPDSKYSTVDCNCQPLATTKEDFEDKKNEFLEKLKLNKTDILKLERQTIVQSNNEEWKKERLCRSASNFGKICKMRKTTIRKNTVISILYQSYYIHGTTTTSYRIQFESIAKPEFETMYNLKVLPASLFVDFNLPFLTASPNGLIENDAIIEIKCPYSAKDFSPDDAQKQNKLKFMEKESENL